MTPVPNRRLIRHRLGFFRHPDGSNDSPRKEETESANGNVEDNDNGHLSPRRHWEHKEFSNLQRRRSDAHLSDRKSEPISSDDSHFSLKMRTNEMDQQGRKPLPSKPKTAVHMEPVEIGPSIRKISYKSVSVPELTDIYEIPVLRQGLETTALSQEKFNMEPVEIGPSIKKISYKSVPVPVLPQRTDTCDPVPRQGWEMTALSVNMEPVEIGPSIKKAPYKLDPGAPNNPQVPQLTDMGEISEPRQGSEIGRKDISRLGEDRGDSAILGRIYHHLCRAMIASAHFENDAYPCSAAGIETAVRDLIRAFEFAYSNTQKLEEALETKEKECKSLTKKNKELVEEYGERVKRIQQEHQSEKKGMTESHQREKERLENELGLLEKQHKEQVLIIEGSTKQLRSEFYDEKAKLSSTIESQKYTFETRLTALRIDTENDKQRVTAEHQATKDEMMRRFEEEKISMRKDLQRLNDQFRKELYKKDREVEEAKKKQEAEEKQLEEQNAAEKLRLEIKKEKEYRKLKGDVEALKGAMVKRDHFKAMSDRDLVPRFKDIAGEIDDFSRVRWDNRREATWPFPDSVLRKSENERRSKQYVIQNTIWAILYERIFCTPFRVLGAQGKLMEQDWIENYGQGELSCMHPINSPHQITESNKTGNLRRPSCLVQCLPKFLRDGDMKPSRLVLTRSIGLY
jgi:hypothetical protein